ncbi:glyoxalase-like domain-containing protein [Hygrophoropsis aurantiaca]|uniref:Glyoxalase-like domain-containing protein n=1 Tax=Hygrophoropsis aurantiaca TaxID=72124 RepID=A0ACB8AL13_9AGAM|nr:glyoxalase-like domain-containing protein [Hygrophoropsis aurantiaca]
MSLPSTKTLDHIVHLTPPGTVEQVSNQFRDLGFTVIPGGTHADGLTANALVVLHDHVYLELISFTHPESHYPPGSPDRLKRDSNPWAHKPPGWIDYAFLGSSVTSIAKIINERARTNLYNNEVNGGRVREDGTVLKWVISAPSEMLERGSAPFFCGDVTPRDLRVPTTPPSNRMHRSAVLGIAYIRVLVDESKLVEISTQLTYIIGDEPLSKSDIEYQWELETPSDFGRTRKPRLILSAPRDDEESEAARGIHEVAFWTSSEGKEGEALTPYGKILWIRAD